MERQGKKIYSRNSGEREGVYKTSICERVQKNGKGFVVE